MVIVSHNVFWLQGAPFEGTEPGEADEAVAGALCALYRRIGADMLLLQEVHSEAALRLLERSSGMKGTWVAGRVHAQYGVAALAEGPFEARGWREMGLEPSRACMVLEFEGVRMACVHLPSGRQEGKERAESLRVGELEAILEASGPDVIAGDMNERPGGGVTRLLSDAGYVDVVDERLGEAATNWVGTRGDYVWVKREMMERVASVRVAGGGEMEAEGRRLSDHWPVRLEIGE